MGFDPSEFGGLSSAKPVNNNIGTGASSPVSSLDTPQETYDPSEFGSNYVPLGDAGESKYDVNLSRQNVQYKDLFRHQKQSVVAQFGNMLNQAVVGEILGGTLENIGYLFDVKQYADLAAGTEQEYGNWFSDIGKSIRTWTEEATPIYQDPNKIGKFSPGEFSWWMANAKSIASTLSLMLPAFGAVKGLSMAGKAIGLTKGLLSMGKAVGMAPETLSWAGTGIARAIVSRHMENLMESSGTYEESLNDALQSGKSYEEAKEIAAKAASNSYKLNWAMLLQDIPEYMILGNFASKASMPLSAKLAKELQLPVTSLLAKKGTDVAFDVLSEGAEEGYQFIVGEESRALAKHLSNPEATKDTFGDRFSSYLKNGELWTNMFMGALGAGVTMGVANIMGKVNRGERLTPEEQRVKQLYDLGAEFTLYNEKLAQAKEDNNEAGIFRAKLGLISTMGRKGAMLGNIEADINFLKNIKEEKYTPEQLAERNMTEENVKAIKEEFSQYEEDLKEFEKIYNKYTDPKSSKVHTPENASILAQNEFVVQKLTEHNNKLADNVSQAEQKVSDEINKLNKGITSDAVSTYAQELLKYDVAIDSQATTLKTLSKRVKDAGKYNLSAEEVKSTQERIDQINTILKTLREEKKAALRDYNKEQKEIDLQNGIAYPDVKDKVPSYKEYLKASQAKFFGDVELSSAKQAYTDNLNRISQLSSDRPATKTKEVEKLYKDLNTEFSKFLETSTMDIDDQTKTVINDLLDKGVSPITLLSGDKLGTLVDDKTTGAFKSITSRLSDNTRNNLNFLLKEFQNKLFFNLTGKVKADVSEEEYAAYIEQVNNHIKQELTKSIEVDLTSEPIFEGEPVTVTKPTKKDTNAVVNEIIDAVTEEDILANELYITPAVLNIQLNTLLLDVNHVKVNYKGITGIIIKLPKGDIIFATDNEKLYTFSKEELNSTLSQLSIKPYKHTLFGSTVKNNTITIGNKTFNLPLIKPYDSFQVNDKGDPISITLGNKVIKHPLIVQELSYAIVLLNEARVNALQLFLHEGELHGVEVTDTGSSKDKKYLVFYDDGAWIVKDPNESGVVKLPNTVNKRVLTELFSALDTIIDNEKTLNELSKQEKDELRETFTNVRRPNPKEVNAQPTPPTVSSVKGVKENETKTGDGSEEAGRSTESGIINNKAEELASNKATNQPELDSVVNEFDDNPVKDRSAEQTTDPIAAGEEAMERIRARREMKRQAIFANTPAVKDLYLYLSDPKNSTVGDRAEFYINTDFTDFFDKHPGLKERIAAGDKTILEDKELVDNIPINSKYITKDGKVLQGYHLPIQSNEKYYEVPYTIEDRADVTKYYESERAKRNELRYKILSMLLEGKTPVATDLEKNKGVPISGTTGVVHNIAKFLGINPRDVRFGVHRKDGHVRDVDGNSMAENLNKDGIGNVYIGTNQTCDGSYSCLKCNPTHISREHADILFEAFRIAATEVQGGNAAYPGLALVNSTVNGKVQHLSVRAVINTLIYQGEDNTKVTNDKNDYLLKKQVFLKDKKLYVGDFEGKRGTGLIIKNFTEEDKARFIDYVTSNLNYHFPISLMNTPAKYSMNIGKLKIKEGEYYNEVVVNNNLVTIETGKHNTFNIPYHNPYLRINVDSIVESTSGSIPTQTIKDVPPPVVTPEPTEEISSRELLNTLKVGDVLQRKDGNEVRTIGKVVTKLGSTYLQLTEKDVLTDSDEGLKELIELTDKKGLDNVYDFYIGAWTGISDNITFVLGGLPTTGTKTGTEGVQKEETEGDGASDLDTYLGYEFGDMPRVGKFNPTYKVIDVEKETAWLKSNLKNVRLDLVDKYIKILSNGRAVHGMFKRNAIILYKAAEEGTGYHEAFHAVSLLYLTEKERAKIYAEARAKYKMPKATNKQVNEKLAEEFRAFMLAGEDTVEVTNPIVRFFKDLLDFIVTFVTGRYRPSDLTIDRLFKSIGRGKYAYARPLANNLLKFNGEEYFHSGPNSLFSAEETDNIVNYMLYLLVNNNNISTPKDLGKISFGPVMTEMTRRQQVLQGIIKNLTAKTTKTDKDNNALTSATQFESVITTVINNFDSFKGLLDDRLMSLNIKKRKDVNDDGEQYNEDEGENESAVVEGTHIARINQSTYEFNKANNILANVKLFISTLPDSKVTYKSSSVHPVTGLPIFSDFKTSWNKLMFDMWRFDNIDDMIEYGISRAKDDIFYKVLIYGITKDNTLIRPGLLNSSELFRTQFYRSLNNFRYNFKAISRYKGKSNSNMAYGVSDPFNLGQANELSRSWASNFLSSQVFTARGDVNKVFLSQILKDFQITKEALAKEIKAGEAKHLNDYVNSTILVLNKIGISVSFTDFTKFLMSEAAGKGISLDAALNNLYNQYSLNDIFGSNGVLNQLLTTGKIKEKEENDAATPVEYFIKNKKIIKDLAKVVTAENIDSVSSTILGPDNNPYYVYAQNSYVTDFIKAINRGDTQLLKELGDDVCLKHSLFLNQIRSGAKLELHTFSSFDNTAYNSLDEEQDFLARFHFMLKGGLIPFPTLADKPTYHMFGGVQGINFRDKVTGGFVDNNGSYEFPSEVYSTIRGYIADETARIAKAKADIKWAQDNNNNSNLILNYHFTIDKKGKVQYNGNALKYTHFPELNDTDGKITDQQIKLHLLNSVKETMDYAEKLGIIRVARFSSGVLNNIINFKLDGSLVKSETDRLGSKWGMYNLLAEYTVNTMIGTIESEKLLSGDAAFYKNIEDKIKRLSALIAPGDSLRSYYKTGELAGKTTYNTITLRTPKYSDNAFINMWQSTFEERVKAKFRETNPDQGELSDAEAKIQAEVLLAPYRNIDAPDGQVFITPAMHREIALRLGEWGDEQESAFDLLLSDKELSIEEESKLSAIVMQPLKLVYFGATNRLGLRIPVYDKMSLATLFPRQLRTNNSKLLPIYNKMVELNIGMLKFDSAVKAGAPEPINYFKTTYDDKGNPDGYTIDTNVLNKLNRQTQAFKNLKMQQDTRPHDINRVLLATQVRKIIADNTSEVSGYLSQLSDLGLKSLEERFGISRDGVVDLNKLVTELRSMAVSRNMPQDTIEHIKVDEKDPTVLYTNIDCHHDRKWLESRIISMIRKATVDTEVPGNSLIQVTSYGYDNIVNSELLQLNTETGVTEIIVSISLYKDVVPKDVWSKGYKTTKAWLLKNQDKLEGIAYRIPTQSPNMVVPYVIKDFLPEEASNTVMVPLAFTALTDSDFDVDKLFIYRYNYKTKDDQLVRGDDVFKPGTRHAIENKLLDTYLTYLTDSDNLLETRAPLSKYVDDLKKVCKYIQKLEGSEDKKTFMYSLTPTYQHRVRHIYHTAKAGVGPYALATVHHALGRSVGLSLNAYIGVGNTVADGMRTDLSQKYGIDGETITNRISSFISGNVDAAKDPYIFYGNINKETWSISALLLRAGYGLDTLYFLAQPILKEVTNKYIDVKTIKKNYRDQLYNALRAEKISTKLNDYIAQFSGYDTIFNQKQLIDNIDIKTTHNAEWYARQLAILDQYDFIKEQSRYLGNTVTASQIDTGGNGNSVLSNNSFKNRVQDTLMSNKVNGFDRMFNDTFLKKYYDNCVVVIGKVFNNLTIGATDPFLEMYDAMYLETRDRNNNDSKYTEKLRATIAKELFSATVSKYFSTKEGLNYATSQVKRLFFGKNSLPDLISQIKQKPNHPLYNNFLIKNLRPVTPSDKFKDFWYLETINRENDKYYRDRMKQAWEELLTSDDEATKKLARALIAYSFYSSGFNRNFYSFYDAIPMSYYHELPQDSTGMSVHQTYDSYVKKVVREYSRNLVTPEQQKELMRDVYLNNWYDEDIVQRISSVNDTQSNKPIYREGKEGLASNVPLVFIYGGDPSTLTVGYTRGNDVSFKPFVTYNNEQNRKLYLYEYVGYVTDIKDGKEVYQPVYKLTNKKGYKDDAKHVIKEYGFENEPSIMDDNNLKMFMGEETIKDKLNTYEGYENFTYTPSSYRMTSYDEVVEEVDETENVNWEFPVTSETKFIKEGKMTLKEYADKYSIKFVNTNEVLRKDVIEYYKNSVEDLIQDRSKYAIFALEDLNNKQYLPFINKLKDNGFKQVIGKEWIFSKGGIDPIKEYEKLIENNEESPFESEEELTESPIVENTTVPKVGDIVTIEFYFEKENKTIPIKTRIKKIEKFYQGGSKVMDNKGNVISEEQGTPEYFVDLEKLDGSKTYEFAVGEDGYITQTLGKNSKTFIGSNNYIPEFDFTTKKSPIVDEEQSPFESDLNIDKIKLIPTGISVEDYNQIVSLAKDDNTTIEQFKEFLTHLRECL